MTFELIAGGGVLIVLAVSGWIVFRFGKHKGRSDEQQKNLKNKAERNRAYAENLANSRGYAVTPDELRDGNY